MSTAPTAHDHLAALSEGLARILQEARYATSVHYAQVREADTKTEFRPFISSSAIKAADRPTTGIKACK
jgi:hypothetical protein